MRPNKINIQSIQSLRPCKKRLDNYIKHYVHNKFTIRQFLRLKNITLDDKVWAVLRLVPRENLRFIAREIALSKEHNFEYEDLSSLGYIRKIEESLSLIADRKVARSFVCTVILILTAAVSLGTAYHHFFAYGAVFSFTLFLYFFSTWPDESADQRAKKELVLKICLKYWKPLRESGSLPACKKRWRRLHGSR